MGKFPRIFGSSMNFEAVPTLKFWGVFQTSKQLSLRWRTSVEFLERSPIFWEVNRIYINLFGIVLDCVWDGVWVLFGEALGTSGKISLHFKETEYFREYPWTLLLSFHSEGMVFRIHTPHWKYGVLALRYVEHFCSVSNIVMNFHS